MDHQARLPVPLPSPNPTPSYWQSKPSDLATYRSATLPAAIDIVIIGSGITGSTLAYNLLSQTPAPTVLLFEARIACSGATGRNGGHTKCASYRTFLQNKRQVGEEEAVRIAQFEYSCMKAVHAFARTMQIDCESWEGGTVDVFFDAEELRLAREAVAEMERLGGGEREEWCRYRFWAGRETEERFLIPRALGAVEYAAGSLSAYAFATGVLRLAVKKGLNLQTEMPVTAIRKAAEGWCVEFARGGGGGEERGGKILAGKVILATNGYTAHLLPELQGVIMPLRGHVTAQRPGANLPSHGLQRTYSFIYASGFDYLISRGQASSFAGDIVIGGGLTKTHQQGLYEYGNTDDASTDENTMRYLRHSARSFFGSRWGADHSDGLVRCEWSGIMGYSPDGYPLVGEMPGKRGLFLAAAFQGHGMVLSFLAARALVLIMMGADAGARTGAGAGAEERELDAWFPAAFRVSEERVARRFQARLHVTAAKGVEVGSVDDG